MEEGKWKRLNVVDNFHKPDGSTQAYSTLYHELV